MITGQGGRTEEKNYSQNVRSAPAAEPEKEQTPPSPQYNAMADIIARHEQIVNRVKSKK